MTRRSPKTATDIANAIAKPEDQTMVSILQALSVEINIVFQQREDALDPEWVKCYLYQALLSYCVNKSQIFDAKLGVMRNLKPSDLPAMIGIAPASIPHVRESWSKTGIWQRVAEIRNKVMVDVMHAAKFMVIGDVPAIIENMKRIATEGRGQAAVEAAQLLLDIANIESTAAHESSQSAETAYASLSKPAPDPMTIVIPAKQNG